jgi:(1->4)-alpha-D-glucan 1-alpha-D-glucosylmutase
MTVELARAVHVYLARSLSQVMMARPEDFLGQIEQVNLPGTTDQYPNWKRKLPLDLEEWAADPRLVALSDALRAERGSAVEPHLPLSK